MHISHLSLTNFRNYGRLELPLSPGTVLFYGNNAQGKTNLLEAVYYLATSRSPQADHDQQLINWNATQTDDPVVVGRLVAQVETAQGLRHLEMRLIQERSQGLRNGRYSFRRQALVDRRQVRLMDLLGTLRVVLFLPQDMQLITGSPSERRRYLDITLCQIDPVYCRALSQYNKVIEQRNALLRQLADGSGSRDLLPVYTSKLASLGSQVFINRAKFMREIAREAQRIHYEELTNGLESLRMHYLPRLQEQGLNRGATVAQFTALTDWIEDNHGDVPAVTARFQQLLKAVQTTDTQRGTTSVGPHRDDWLFEVNGRNVSRFGSRGQQRSAILALKLAEINWMKKMTNDTPILLLDEVVAELDESRRQLLLSYVQQANQALLTATDRNMFPPSFLQHTTSMTVSNGRLLNDQ